MAPLLPPPLRNVKEPLPLKTRPPFEIRLQNTHFVPDNVTERSMPLRSKLTALASEALSPKAKSKLIDNGLNTKSSFIVIVLGPCEAYSCTLPDIVALTENDPVQSSDSTIFCPSPIVKSELKTPFTFPSAQFSDVRKSYVPPDVRNHPVVISARDVVVPANTLARIAKSFTVVFIGTPLFSG